MWLVHMTATHCITLQHTATYRNTPYAWDSCAWLPATHCNTLQHAATHHLCKTRAHTATHCNTLQHTATHCNTLQHTATHCNRLRMVSSWIRIVRPESWFNTCCNTLQHTATHGNTLQHTASRRMCEIRTHERANAFIHAPCLIQMCAVTHSCVWQDSCTSMKISADRHWHMNESRHIWMGVTHVNGYYTCQWPWSVCECVWHMSMGMKCVWMCMTHVNGYDTYEWVWHIWMGIYTHHSHMIREWIKISAHMRDLSIGHVRMNQDKCAYDMQMYQDRHAHTTCASIYITARMTCESITITARRHINEDYCAYAHEWRRVGIWDEWRWVGIWDEWRWVIRAYHVRINQV